MRFIFKLARSSSKVILNLQKCCFSMTKLWGNKKCDDFIEGDDESIPATEPYGGEYRSSRHLFNSEFGAYKKLSNEIFDPPIPRESDIVVIGGGALGLTAAYWIKQLNPEGYKVVLIEKDPTYVNSSSLYAIQGIRNQFFSKEKIQMSLFSAEFFRNIKDYLSVMGLASPNIYFNPQGSLLLANETNANKIKESSDLQKSLGIELDIFDSKKLNEKFPWMNTSDIEIASYGLQNEGWIEPSLYMAALKVKLASMGVIFITGDLVGFNKLKDELVFDFHGNKVKRSKLTHVHVKTANGKVHPIQFMICVNCAGAWSGHVSRLAGIGKGEGPLSVKLPIKARKRYIYILDCKEGPVLDMPMIFDTSGLFLRRQGLTGSYICMFDPDMSNDTHEASLNNISAEDYFYAHIQSSIIHRIPAFKSLKLLKSLTTFIDYNTLDGQPIIGNHPYHRNFFMGIAGDADSNLQLAPAIGRALMEEMLLENIHSIDLSMFACDRILYQEPISIGIN